MRDENLIRLPQETDYVNVAFSGYPRILFCFHWMTKMFS